MSRTFQFLLLLSLAGIVRAVEDAYKIVTDGPHSCGGVDIPYPFGIDDGNGNGDFHEGFGVVCDAGKPVLPTTGGDEKPIPIGNFSIERAEARVWLPVGWQCYNSSGGFNGSQDYTDIQFNNDGVYRISHARNYFFVLGCATLGFLRSKPRPVAGESNSTFYTQLAGCACYCEDSKSAVSGGCSGVGCCRADIPPDLVDNTVEFRSGSIDNGIQSISFSPCDYAFLAEKDYYTFHTSDLNMDLHRKPLLMPVTLDWAIRDNLTCQQAMEEKAYACRSNNSRCLNSTNGPGYVCTCSDGYEGNPYILDGCIDINECEHRDHYPCEGVCKNIQGSYECTCRKRSHSANPFKKPCIPSFSLNAKISLGALVVLLIVICIVFGVCIIREKRKREVYIQNNGGTILQNLANIKLYKNKDIKKIKKKSNFVGHGFFGNVYKGCIGNDPQLVAVKVPINQKSKLNDTFTNEIIIQSRVSHKNIVRLLGCCIEVEVPILVYEFVPKGNLDVILHGDKSIPLSLGQRLQIAAESAEGLAFMHSKTTAKILHGDVKPANILINNDYAPKISDFGISRLIATDMEHTGTVIGDVNYMDPVFVQTGMLTNKSDVYSFGVVLLELITRKKASRSNQNGLLSNFSEAYKKDKSMIELVDKELVEVDPQLLYILAGIINECLSLDVNERPYMTDIEERLRDIVKRFRSTE